MREACLPIAGHCDCLPSCVRIQCIISLERVLLLDQLETCTIALESVPKCVQASMC